MNIHEYQAKELFDRYGIPVHKGCVASTPEEVYEGAKAIAQKDKIFVVKAQIHAGARGKGGGIKLVKTPEEAREAASKILGRNLVTPQTGPEGRPVQKVLIETTSPIHKEFYASVVLDRTEQAPCLIVSCAGGMEIEEVAAKEPDKIIKQHFCAQKGLDSEKALEIAAKMTEDSTAVDVFAQTFQAMAKLFVEKDASLVEINPLAIMESGDVLAIDAKINIDDNALYRQPEILGWQDFSQEDSREVEAKKFDLSYVGLTGDIGCIVNGAGLAMATMDIIKYAGGEPANFLDVGGGANKEKVAAAFKIILTDPDVKAILVNIFGGIMRCDIVAEGILAAVDELKAVGNTRIEQMPLVVRLEGTNVEQGKEILKKSSLKIIAASTFEEAAQKVVAAIKV
ncbi:MAG: ADP-forming succinate--CoA ligase subunit beta [Candidatus Omnitrophica bacterium]|nr:ADP-forming succinate--CoA ligase subunit beta [Candidatus Omnitrophota bacterium]